MSQAQNFTVAAVQMCAELAEVDKNLRMAERLIRKAAEQGATWVILPEFFTSACAFHPKMLDAILPIDGKAKQLLISVSKELNIVVGGSFLAKHENDVFNTFILAFPNGEVHIHNKDIPTMWENCYYTGGGDSGVLETTSGSVGVALCWEMLRTQTAKRLLEKVNFVVSGSCWWNLPESAPKKFDKLRDESLRLLKKAPVDFAKILGVPVVHAGHAGEFAGFAPPSEEKKYVSHYLGETQIVGGYGNVLACMSRAEGEGVVIAEIDKQEISKPSQELSEGYWIPKMPKAFLSEWESQNKFGEDYYKNRTIQVVN